MIKETQELLSSLAGLNREIRNLQEICAIVNTHHAQVLESLEHLIPPLMQAAEKSSASAATRCRTIAATTVAAAARHPEVLATAASTRSQRGTPSAAGTARGSGQLAHATFGFAK
jgi:hypothetical protein